MSLRTGITRRPMNPKNASTLEGIIKASAYVEYLVQLRETEYLDDPFWYPEEFQLPAVGHHSPEPLDQRSYARTVDVRDFPEIDEKHGIFFPDQTQQFLPQFRGRIHVDVARQPEYFYTLMFRYC